MKNIPDKEFDDIFKKAAENLEVKFNPAAWEKLEKKLNGSAPKNGYWKIVLPIVILLVTGSIIGWSILPHTLSNSQATKNVVEVNDKKDEIYDNGQNSITENQNKDEDHRQIKAGANSNIGINGRKIAPVNYYIAATKDLPEVKEDVFLGTGNNNLDVAKPLKPTLEAVNFRMGLIEKIEVITSRKRLFSPYFTFGLKVSPDFSGTGIDAFAKTGNNIGISLSYQLTPRFSISSGIIRSRKIYTVEDGFEPYKGYWDYKQKPDLIDGGCIVFDIPLNINYKVLLKEKYNLFVSTGLSSYIMANEDYKYVYYNYSNDYEIKSGKSHFFSIMNLSVGYERQIGQQWTLGIEPFMKMPLAEIGYGNLKLMSAGAYFSINYQFKKRRP